METIRIEQMADEFFMSRSHLTTRFKKETGQTLSDYIQSEKIREAKRMLVQDFHNQFFLQILWLPSFLLHDALFS